MRALAGPYLAADGKVIDRIETATVSQVDVKVYIMEVDETALRQLGVNLQSAIFHPDGSYTLAGPQFTPVENPTWPGSNKGFTIQSFFRNITLAPTSTCSSTTGTRKLLSSPDLVTLPGKQADFLVGGQIPIPYAAGPQQIAIAYKEFGVKLMVTPKILRDGSVETVVSPEVSDLDFPDGVSLNGFVVPALKTSKLSTDVITQAGESIVMGGLLRRQEQRNVHKIPGWATSRSWASCSARRVPATQSDVVFVMTPEILTR